LASSGTRAWRATELESGPWWLVRRAGNVAIQRAFAQRNESAEEPIRLRIGLHTGEVTKEGTDFFGRHVTLAARIAGQAQGGEILVSSLLREVTEGAGEFTFGEGRKVELKGLKGKHQVFEVTWE
jgi:adenylate cyclase